MTEITPIDTNREEQEETENQAYSECNDIVLNADEFTPKQFLFIIEYLKDGNGTQAAIRAGYSKKIAREVSSQNLTKPNIREEIKRQRRLQVERLAITNDSVLAGVAKIANADIRRAFDDNGHLLPIKDIPDDIACALSSVESDELYGGQGEDRERVGDTRKIKVADKLKAHELLLRYLKLINSNDAPGGSGPTQINIIIEREPPVSVTVEEKHGG